MIQYDFDASFWNPITSGEKRATVRRIRTKPRRHARPGEAIELWAEVDGRRLQIAKKECAGVDGILFHAAADMIALGDITQNRRTWPVLDAGGREGLARLTGLPGWKAAREYYEARYGEDPVTLCLVAWRDREYIGPTPTAPQLRDLRMLSQHKQIIPRYGKISTAVGHGLLVLGWAEVTDNSHTYLERGDTPIRISELGRWILERFEK